MAADQRAKAAAFCLSRQISCSHSTRFNLGGGGGALETHAGLVVGIWLGRGHPAKHIIKQLRRVNRRKALLQLFQAPVLSGKANLRCRKLDPRLFAFRCGLCCSCLGVGPFPGLTPEQEPHRQGSESTTATGD